MKIILMMKVINKIFPLPTVSDFVDHIEYIINLVGIDYVGIASDFGGGGGIDGWIDASETKNITLALKERGYSKSDIKKVWSENILRVWTEADNFSSREAMHDLFD